jgi:hypothetical protein
MEINVQRHASAVLPPRKILTNSLDRSVVGLQIRYGGIGEEKDFSL